MIERKTRIICDRCGGEMETTYGKTWLKSNAKKWTIKLRHEIPQWGRTDEFHLCDMCAEELKQFMKGEKRYDV